jgi:uncharacterized membrane protein
MLTEIGRWLIGVGILLIIIGGILLLVGRFSLFGRLPGDILIEREHMTIFLPLGTMLLVSLILTVIVNVLARIWQNK